MQLEQKMEIYHLLKQYMEQKAQQGHSQKVAADMLHDVSEATVISILQNKWNSISEAMWRNVGVQVGWRKKQNEFVETLNAITLITMFATAKENGEMLAITGEPGAGKSFTGKFFADSMRGKNAWYVTCAEYWNKKYFLIEILKSMGKEYAGLNVYELMEKIVYELRRQEAPLLIIDEVDKLSPDVLLFFVTLYNKLHRMCGIVWMSTDTIKTQIEKGMRRGKKGYKELYSRIGKTFVQLEVLNADEIEKICEANGIKDKIAIRTVINECEGDIRRLDRNYLKAETMKHLKKYSKSLKAA
jgi:DNA transposition AAA+ family ATPase